MTIIIKCPKCGGDRELQERYWNNLWPKRRAKILAKVCKKCGTGRKKLHGLGSNKIYMVWYNMMVRCGHLHRDDLSERVAKSYRDKGIRVCKKWQNLEDFAAWAFAHGYKPRAFLDRIDNNKNYNPKNCRWVTPRFSGQNRSNLKLDFDKAEQIRHLYQQGQSIEVLSNLYEVSSSTIERVCDGRAWS